MAHLTDEQIISQIKEGNEQALVFLLEKSRVSCIMIDDA